MVLRVMSEVMVFDEVDLAIEPHRQILVESSLSERSLVVP